MTREEAARVIESHAKHGFGTGLFGLPEAFTAAVTALRGPQPDPITGLVPCGCGCNPEFRVDDRGWCQVYCTGCDMHGGNSHSIDNVIEEWNEAMGWKGGAK